MFNAIDFLPPEHRESCAETAIRVSCLPAQPPD